MLAPSSDPENRASFALDHEASVRLFRTVGPSGGYRTKNDVEPVLPLPRWASWVMLVWMVGAVGAYSVILARWWE